MKAWQEILRTLTEDTIQQVDGIFGNRTLRNTNWLRVCLGLPESTKGDVDEALIERLKAKGIDYTERRKARIADEELGLEFRTKHPLPR